MEAKSFSRSVDASEVLADTPEASAKQREILLELMREAGKYVAGLIVSRGYFNGRIENEINWSGIVNDRDVIYTVHVRNFGLPFFRPEGSGDGKERTAEESGTATDPAASPSAEI